MSYLIFYALHMKMKTQIKNTSSPSTNTADQRSRILPLPAQLPTLHESPSTLNRRLLTPNAPPSTDPAQRSTFHGPKRWPKLCSFSAVSGSVPDAAIAASEVNWESILKTTIRYATEKINHLRWRGSIGGVLPDGYDGKSIASQAIADLLETGQDRFHPVPNLLPNARAIQLDLYRRVNQHINRLYHRKERLLIRNEPDLALVFVEDGEYIPYIETVADTAPSPAEAIINQEKAAELNRFETDFQIALGKSRRLVQTFEAMRDGIHQPRLIGRRLGLRPHTINKLQKRLRRQAVKFCKTHPFPSER